jgi:hypothetical protein
MTKPIDDDANGTEVADPAGQDQTEVAGADPFDPAMLRLSQDPLAATGVKKALIRVPVRRPGPQEFFRVHPGENFHVDTAIIDLKEDREVYLVAPELRAELFAEIKPVRLFTTISRQGVVALWPCKLPAADGRSNSWYDTALTAAGLAMTRWIKIIADTSLGGYQPYHGAVDLPEPEWPEQTFAELLKIAFSAFYIDRPDHPVIRRLRGLV